MDQAERIAAWRRVGDAPGWLLPAAAIALAAFAVLALGSGLFADGDTSWHLAAGDWILAHRAVPHVDPFSFTFAGRPWAAHEWLAEVIMAGAFAAGSWSALGLLFAAAIAALLLAIGWSIGRHLAAPALLVALCLVAAVLAPAALARPHVLAWLLLALWLDALLRAREAGRAPPLAAVLVMLVWANLHASFLYGLGLAAALAIEALAQQPHAAVLRRWAGFGALALLAAVATPNGIDGLVFPIQLSTMQSLPFVTEWRPTDFRHQPGFALLIGTGLYAVVKWPVRVPPIRIGIVIATLVMALAHARHQAIFAIVAPMLLAPSIGRSMPAGGPARFRPWPLLGMILAAAGAVAAVALASPILEQDSANDPVTMLDSLPPSLFDRPVLNGYAFGGPLIRRRIAPFIDGRADMYGDAFVTDYGRIEGGDMAAFRAAAARYGIGWTILPPGSPLVSALDREPGWRRLRADQWAVVHVRASPDP